MSTKNTVIVALAATASTNPYLDADNHLNVERVKALNLLVVSAFNKAQEAAPKPIKALQTFLISRKAKPIKYSAAMEKKADLKYLTQRAMKVGVVKRVTERSQIRNMPLLAVYDNVVLGGLAAKVKQAISAITSHLKRADKTKLSVGKVKTKIRDEANKVFDAAITSLRDVLLGGGLKESDLVIGTSIFGKSMMVKLGNNVISVGKSDLLKFKAAVKAAKAVA